jgi:hypothetical protein
MNKGMSVAENRMHRWYAVLLVMAFASCLPFAAPGQDQTTDPANQPLIKLQNENQELRKTVEIQTQELLELRNRVKDMESAMPDYAGDDASRVVLGRRNWNFSVGATYCSVFDAGDAVIQLPGSYHTSGAMMGYEVSAGKDTDKVGLTAYTGEYDTDVKSVSAEKNAQAECREKNTRTDIELAWSRIAVRSDRFGIGFYWGARYLRADKTLTRIEVSGDTRDEKEFSGANDWMLGSLGVFISTRFIREWPLSFFTSGSASIGMVRGMVVDSGDNVWDDGIIQTAYHTESMTAWALTGTLGLQYPVTEHAMIRLGYRAQGLNSIDGFRPFVKTGTFYDGHQGGVAGLSILF